MALSITHQEMPTHPRLAWPVGFDFITDDGNGTKIGLGANFENHELGSTFGARNQADFYARSTDFDESTEIDRKSTVSYL